MKHSSSVSSSISDLEGGTVMEVDRTATKEGGAVMEKGREEAEENEGVAGARRDEGIGLEVVRKVGVGWDPVPVQSHGTSLLR